MGNVLAALFIILVIGGLIALLVRQARRPERRLLRDFRRLRSLILKQLDRDQRPGARRMLDDCERYLKSLLLTREQHELLRNLTASASEITGRSTAPATLEAIQIWRQRASQQLDLFFAQLARVATTAGIHQEEALDGLREFAEDIENQRLAMAQLTAELAASSTSRSSDLSPDAPPDEVIPSSAEQSARRG